MAITVKQLEARKPRAKTHRVRDKQSRPNTGTPLDKHPDNVIPFIKHTA